MTLIQINKQDLATIDPFLYIVLIFETQKYPKNFCNTSLFINAFLTKIHTKMIDHKLTD